MDLSVIVITLMLAKVILGDGHYKSLFSIGAQFFAVGEEKEREGHDIHLLDTGSESPLSLSSRCAESSKMY